MKTYENEWPEREWAKDKEIERLRAALQQIADKCGHGDFASMGAAIAQRALNAPLPARRMKCGSLIP